MTTWILPCNVEKKYDIFGAFNELQRIDWHQTKMTRNIEVDDIAYIYATKIGICFKCRVTKINVHSLEIDDRKFAKDHSYETDVHEYFEIELLKKYPKDKIINYETLKANGLKSTLEGPLKVKDELLTFLDDEIILNADKNMAWDKIYVAINECFGTNYSGWMTACWPNVSGNGKFRAWFNKLAIKGNGTIKSAAFDCVNTISDDGNEFIYDDLKGRQPDPGAFYSGYDLIFSKDYNGPYVFRGLFKLDKDKSAPNHCVSKRIAKKVKIIGRPAYDIEILNDINIPLEPEAIETDVDGCVKVICGNCRTAFKKAPRCPECGQIQKYEEML